MLTVVGLIEMLFPSLKREFIHLANEKSIPKSVLGVCAYTRKVCVRDDCTPGPRNMNVYFKKACYCTR